MANAALQNLFTLFRAGRHAGMAAKAREPLAERPGNLLVLLKA